jgi:hypothetical protein
MQSIALVVHSPEEELLRMLEKEQLPREEGQLQVTMMEGQREQIKEPR